MTVDALPQPAIERYCVRALVRPACVALRAAKAGQVVASIPQVGPVPSCCPTLL